MENDPIVQALGGEGMVIALVGLFCLISLLPHGWNAIYRIVFGLVGFIFGVIDDYIWYFWTKPRLETKMWVHEQESRQLLGAGSRVPARFRARVAREIERNAAREQKITEKYFAEKAAREKAAPIVDESARRPLVAPQLARVSTSWTDEQNRFFQGFGVNGPTNQ